ncbi:hypothetical protein ACFC66_12315 [Streptomyces bacillaris]|uniref:hypothetical protein n=1 Tax=Streptomyces bacillaris TaxID=68179 RepID=UPI0035D6E5E0
MADRRYKRERLAMLTPAARRAPGETESVARTIPAPYRLTAITEEIASKTADGLGC